MERQKQILKVFNGDCEKILTKQEIIELAGISYYCSTSKNAGNTLSRMVNNGSLIRVSKGKFKLGKGKYKVLKDEVPPNQTKLF